MICQCCTFRSGVGFVDVQPYEFGKGLQWKKAFLCAECFDLLDVDMWTCRQHWEAVNPAVPFDKLENIPE